MCSMEIVTGLPASLSLPHPCWPAPFAPAPQASPAPAPPPPAGPPPSSSPSRATPQTTAPRRPWRRRTPPAPSRAPLPACAAFLNSPASRLCSFSFPPLECPPPSSLPHCPAPSHAASRWRWSPPTCRWRCRSCGTASRCPPRRWRGRRGPPRWRCWRASPPAARVSCARGAGPWACCLQLAACLCHLGVCVCSPRFSTCLVPMPSFSSNPAVSGLRIALLDESGAPSAQQVPGKITVSWRGGSKKITWGGEPLKLPGPTVRAAGVALNLHTARAAWWCAASSTVSSCCGGKGERGCLLCCPPPLGRNHRCCFPPPLDCPAAGAHLCG